jgi:hypothetical protein
MHKTPIEPKLEFEKSLGREATREVNIYGAEGGILLRHFRTTTDKQGL